MEIIIVYFLHLFQPKPVNLLQEITDFFLEGWFFMKKAVFTGVCTALVTPFDGTGINYKKLDELLEHQITNGVGAVCVCGTTGEAATMTQEEQLSVIAHTVKHCSGRIKVIAGTGSNRAG